MGFFSRRFAEPANWHAIEEGLPHKIGPVTLDADGVFAIGPMRFSPSTSIANSRIGGALVNKKAGVSEVVAIDSPSGEKFRFQFKEGRWHFLR